MTTVNLDKFESYFNQIKEGLGYEPEKQHQVLKDLKTSVSDYLEDHPDATVEDICDSFGTPEEIIRDNTDQVPVGEVKKAKRIKYWVIGAIAVIIVVFVGFLIASFIDGYSANRGYAVVQGGEVSSVSNSAVSN